MKTIFSISLVGTILLGLTGFKALELKEKVNELQKEIEIKNLEVESLDYQKEISDIKLDIARFEIKSFVNRFEKPLKSFRISSDFGMRSINGKLHFHSGQDFFAYYDTLISPTKGVIQYINPFSRNNAAGKYVKLVDENGLMHIFCHLHNISPILRIGMKVEKGQIIGVTGNTGKPMRGMIRYGYHLHYTLKKKNGNKYQFLRPTDLFALKNEARELLKKDPFKDDEEYEKINKAKTVK